MFKKICSFLLVMCMFLSLISCSATKDINDTPEKAIIGFISASNSELAAKSYIKTGSQLVGYNSLSDLLLAIENGYVNYGVLSDYEYIRAVNTKREIEIFEECPYKINFCAYFRDDSIELCNQFNASVKKMKDNGVIDEIVNSEYNGVSYHSSYTGKGENQLNVLCTPSVDLFMYLRESGQYTGIDVNVLENFAEDNNYSLSYTPCEDEEMFLKLYNGEGDMIISAVVFNEQRTENYLASDVYLTVGFKFVTRKPI